MLTLQGTAVKAGLNIYIALSHSVASAFASAHKQPQGVSAVCSFPTVRQMRCI